MAIFVQLDLLETKFAVRSPQVPGQSRQQPSQVPWREMWQLQLACNY